MLEIAIIGAGVSSLCLARGLLKYNNIHVWIYEARSQIGLDGSGFGIGGNGQTALGLIDAELLACLDRAGGVKGEPMLRIMMGTGPRSGELVTEYDADIPQRTVTRSKFLAELVKILPADVIETGKRLAGIEQKSDGGKKVDLIFEDGSKSSVDAVVGCDGINSFVRRYVLGKDHPQLEPRWSPGYNTRIVIPKQQAISIFGPEYCKDLTQTGWIGEDGFCLTDFEDEGESMQVIAGCNSDKPVAEVFGKPFVEVEKEFWTSRLKDWGWVGEKITQVIDSQDKVFAASLRHHDETPSYYNGRICIAGDAALTFPPARGAGAGQGIEDALMLHAVLGNAEDPDGIEKAFQVYDSLRRPRRTEVAKASQQARDLLTGRQEGVGLDVEKLAQAFESWNDFIFDYDFEAAMEKARSLMTGREPV